MKRFFSSESVTSGHPDKVCDYIADSILDAALTKDPYSQMAVEATIKDDFILIYGEANTKANLDYEKIAKSVMKEIGYFEDYTVLVKVNKQSSEISNAVNSDELGAGDQGIMFGYASDETEEFMPLPITLAHKLAKRLEEVRRENPDMLGPDGKTQVTVEYDDDKVIRIDTIVVSTQHSESVTQEHLSYLIKSEVIDEVIDSSLMDENTIILINPSGSFIVGGSFGDSGTTGRKIVVDTYGGMAPIGGGCFSSKDATKVDRSGAYYARYVAKNIVANKLAKKCLIQLSYAIGKSDALSIYVDTYGTSKYSDEEIIKIIKRNFSFKVNDIINELELRKPIYRNTTNYGHFGKENMNYENVKVLV